MIRAIFDDSPMPSQMMKGETHAMGGMNRNNWTYGSKNIRTRGNVPKNSPRGNPTKLPTRNPAKMRPMLAHMWVCNWPDRIKRIAVSKVFAGGGKNSEAKNVVLTKCQTRIKVTMPAR